MYLGCQLLFFLLLFFLFSNFKLLHSPLIMIRYLIARVYKGSGRDMTGQGRVGQGISSTPSVTQ